MPYIRQEIIKQSTTPLKALAATLFIVGLEEDAKSLMAPFAWGPEFLRLNHRALTAYAGGCVCVIECVK